jgi:hypothetical protein
MNAGFPAAACPAADIPAIAGAPAVSEVLTELGPCSCWSSFSLWCLHVVASLPLMKLTLFLVSLLTKKYTCFRLLAYNFRTDQFFAVGLYLGV